MNSLFREMERHKIANCIIQEVPLRELVLVVLRPLMLLLLQVLKSWKTTITQ